MTGEELKKFIADRNLKNKDLASLLGYTDAAVNMAILNNKVSKPMATACKMLERIEELEAASAELEQIKEFFRKLSK